MSYTLKTQKNTQSIRNFLESLENQQKKSDAFSILQIFQNITWEEWSMWGENIIWFGTYHYKYASWQEGDWMRTGFSPRKNNFSLYIMPGYQFDGMQELLWKLWKYKLWKSCLYIKKLSDIDEEILKQIIQKWLSKMAEKYPG